MTLDEETEHTLKNHLAVILGYCELMLDDTAPGDPRHGDLLEMQRAAQTAISILGRETEE